MEKIKEFIKKMSYGSKTLILLIITIIFTFITPVNTRTSLIRVVLIIAFFYYLIRWIYNKIFSKRSKVGNSNEKLEEQTNNSMKKEDKQIEEFMKDKKNGGAIHQIKHICEGIINYISGIKPWLWALIFFILGLILAGGNDNVSTGGMLCFVCRCLGVVIYIYTKSNNKKIVSNKSKKMSLEIAESIKNGTYPEVNADIPVDDDEKVYGIYKVSMIKERTVRSTTSFGGPTASIKIMKGVRYRVGSISHTTESSKESYHYDYGMLYVTTKRFIYIGDKETDTIKAKDIIKLMINGNNIYIYKSKGKPNRYQFVGNYDTFLGVMQGLNHFNP